MAKKQIEQTEIEAPYELPEGWKWVRLDFLLTEVKNGTTIKQSKNIDGPKVTRIESLQNQTIDFNRLGVIINESEIKENDWYIADDIALSHINSAEHVGKTALITSDMLPLVHGMNLLRLRFVNNFYPKLFHFYSQSFQYKAYIQNHMNMAVNQVSINQKQVSSIPFPLPPTLDEQQRIVNRIETLFAKLDEAKEKVQNVVDTFETRKASILHKAFTGELTKKWREENGVGDDSWEEKMIGECCQVKGGKRVPKGMSLIKTPNEHPYLKAGNLKNGTVIDKDMEYVPDDVLKFIKNYTVQTNDLYITNVGACIGDCGIIPEKYNGANLTENAVKLTELNCNNNYLAIQLSSNIVQQQISEKIKSATLGKLSIDNIKQLKINIPTLSEQQEIVRIVDVILEKENKANESAKAVLEQIDLLKKTILARAFRGEI